MSGGLVIPPASVPAMQGDAEDAATRLTSAIKGAGGWH